MLKKKKSRIIFLVVLVAVLLITMITVGFVFDFFFLRIFGIGFSIGIVLSVCFLIVLTFIANWVYGGE